MGGKHRLGHIEPLLRRKQRLFPGMNADRDDQAVAQADRVPDHIEVAIVTGSNEPDKARCGACPRLPRSMGSRKPTWFPPIRFHELLYFWCARTIPGVSASTGGADDVSENITLSGAMFRRRKRMKQLTGATKPHSPAHEELLNGR